MESEAIERKYKLNEKISASVKTVREKSKYKNKITIVFEEVDDAPMDFDSKKRLIGFLSHLDYEDNQTTLIDDDQKDGK